MRNPNNVNIYHPIIMKNNPMKKNALPITFDFFVKKPNVLLTPISDTIPIMKDI